MTDSTNAPRSTDPLTCLIETVAHLTEALNLAVQDLPAGSAKEAAVQEMVKAYYQLGGVAKATGIIPQAVS
jgi:hypothetical protein